MKKGQLDISFTWIFGLIVGVIILGLAIYAATKIVSTGEKTVDASTAQQISVLLNPLQLGVEDFKSTTMSFSTNTRIYPGCDLNGEFGNQRILVSQESLGKWTDSGMNVSAKDLYLFSDNPSEGKSFKIFSKKFEFPYKVSDLIYIISSDTEYCFVNAPENIEDDIKNFNLENLKLNCSDNSVKVCFSDAKNCDVLVNYNSGTITKREGTVYFSEDSLMYGGIFSAKANYECQVKRLMKKTAILASIYNEKASLITRAGCSSNVDTDLIVFKSAILGLSSSQEIFQMQEMAENLGEKNDENSKCKLW